MNDKCYSHNEEDLFKSDTIMDTTNYTQTKTSLYFLGDIHGEFESIAKKIQQLKIENAHIVQVGDFGLGFLHPHKEKSKLSILNEVLKKYNIQMWAIRGNHDKPSFFAERNNPYDLSNIILLPDYSEINLAGKNILLAGGAVSVDRIFRKEGVSWWRDEGFVFDENFSYKKYDVVVTHSRPIESGLFFSFSNIREFLQEDKTLESSLEEELALMSKFYEKVRGAPNWYFGHFHESAESFFDGTKFKALRIDEFDRLC